MSEREKKLHEIAERVLSPQAAFTQQEIVQEMMSKLNIAEERATTGFKAMKEVGAIKETLHPNWYYLVSSTPF